MLKYLPIISCQFQNLSSSLLVGGNKFFNFILVQSWIKNNRIWLKLVLEVLGSEQNKSVFLLSGFLDDGINIRVAKANLFSKLIGNFGENFLKFWISLIFYIKSSLDYMSQARINSNICN